MRCSIPSRPNGCHIWGLRGSHAKASSRKVSLNVCCIFADVAIIPCHIDNELFYPREKDDADCVHSAETAARSRAIQKIFELKYKELQWARWVPIENRTEREIG